MKQQYKVMLSTNPPSLTEFLSRIEDIAKWGEEGYCLYDYDELPGNILWITFVREVEEQPTLTWATTAGELAHTHIYNTSNS